LGNGLERLRFGTCEGGPAEQAGAA
jgi:hypothetical protein